MNKKLDPVKIVLIPAFQPSETLNTIANKLVKAGFQLVVVDDGSGAKYQPIFAKLPTNVKLLRQPKNLGKGAALKSGCRYIAKNYDNFVVVTADADGQHSPNDITKMFKTYRYHQKSLLLGVREFSQDNVPLRSRIGNVLTRRILSFMLEQNLSDTQTGLRAFDDDLMPLVLETNGDRFEYETNMLLNTPFFGVTIDEVPINTIYRGKNHSSHFNAVTDSFAIYKEIAKFASSSLVTFIVDYLLFIGLSNLTSGWGGVVSLIYANILARIVSASLNFYINRKIVFRHSGKIFTSAASYFTLVLAVMIGNTLLLNLLVNGLGWSHYFAKIITEISFFAVSYTIQKKLIFTKKGAKTI